MGDQKVTGFGGVFFQSKDPKNSIAWYEKNPGLISDPDGIKIELWEPNDPAYNEMIGSTIHKT
jgi:hypothetical protein